MIKMHLKKKTTIKLLLFPVNTKWQLTPVQQEGPGDAGLGGRGGFHEGFNRGLRGCSRGHGHGHGAHRVKLKTKSGPLSPRWAAWLRM